MRLGIAGEFAPGGEQSACRAGSVLVEHEIIKFRDMNQLIGDAYTKQLLSGKSSAADMATAIKPQFEALIAENTQLTNAK